MSSALVALLLALQAPAAPEGLPRTTPAEAAAGAAACRGLPDDYEAAVRRLLDTGWERATPSGPPQPNAQPLPIFGRGHVILLLPPPDPAHPMPGTGCMVTVAFERGVRWADVVAAATAAFAAPAESSSDSGAIWQLDDGRYLVMLMRRDQRGVPGATFVVAPTRPAGRR
ncbi:MAG TPA: hypothetical protein VGW40_08545 [Allosphingosinicella sp.]|nr:hypothetical protein [Allosphingosinicella sp.]